MTTYSDQVNREYVTAYLADITSGLGSKRRPTVLLSTLRRYADRLRSGNGLEADTRQIRSFDLSKLPGACEVRLGPRLAI